MSWEFTSSGGIVRATGLNGNSEIKVSSAALVEFADQAQANVCVRTRYNWITNIATVPTNLKPILEDAANSYAAIRMIRYDPSGYTNQDEVLTIVNILLNDYDKNINLLKEQETKDFIGVS